MAEVLVDSSVLLDVLTNDPVWFNWSSPALAAQAQSNVLVVNFVIFAEISIGFTRMEDLEATLASAAIELRSIPVEAAFLAGKCFKKYRASGGSKRSPLPDFFIGAHAAVEKMPLVTRDEARYRTYFPSLVVISP